LDYDVVREPWNRYELESGSILRTKYVLNGLTKQLQEGDKTGYSAKGQNIVTLSHIPFDKRGRPAERPYSPPEIQSAIINEDVRYTTLREEWNEYVAEDGARVRVKLTVVRVASTSLYNMEGGPIYHVNSSVMVQIKPPKK